MAAGEHEPEPVVGDSANQAVHRVLLLAVLAERLELGQHPGLLAQPPFPAQPIDGLVAGGPCDPCARVPGDAVGRPPGQRDGERILDGFLGKVEVPEDPDERRQRTAALLPEGPLDDLPGVLRDGPGARADILLATAG